MTGGPLFDAHAQHNVEAVEAYPVAAVLCMQ